MYNKNSFYDGKQKYKIVRTITDSDGNKCYETIADGFTSQKAVREYYKELRQKGIDTKEFTTMGYK